VAGSVLQHLLRDDRHRGRSVDQLLLPPRGRHNDDVCNGGDGGGFIVFRLRDRARLSRPLNLFVHLRLDGYRDRPPREERRKQPHRDLRHHWPPKNATMRLAARDPRGLHRTDAGDPTARAPQGYASGREMPNTAGQPGLRTLPCGPQDAVVPMTPEPAGAARFTTTRWSVVLAAQRDSTPQAREALNQLCERYWHPLYAYLRRSGHGADEAQDLTQAFFAEILEKHTFRDADPARGRFRSFLLASLKNFAANERERAHTKKRGGPIPPLSFEFETAEEQYQIDPPGDDTLETVSTSGGRSRCSRTSSNGCAPRWPGRTRRTALSN